MHLQPGRAVSAAVLQEAVALAADSRGPWSRSFARLQRRTMKIGAAAPDALSRDPVPLTVELGPGNPLILMGCAWIASCSFDAIVYSSGSVLPAVGRWDMGLLKKDLVRLWRCGRGGRGLHRDLRVPFRR